MASQLLSEQDPSSAAAHCAPGTLPPTLNIILYVHVFSFTACLPACPQFLLSQAHRLQALELLGRFLDLGPWAVHAALNVGIFPYVLKLLGSKLRELQPILVFIWAKILAVDPVSGFESLKTCVWDIQFTYVPFTYY